MSVPIRSFLLLILLCGTCMNGEAREGDHPKDEMLLVVRGDDLASAPLSIANAVRVYYRLPDELIIGADRMTMDRMVRNGIPFVLIDDRPWSQEYGIVPVGQSRYSDDRYRGLAVHFVHRFRKYDLVKGSGGALDALRARGVKCVPMGRYGRGIQEARFHPSPLGITAPRDDIRSIIDGVSDSAITETIRGLAAFGTRYCLNQNREQVFQWVKDAYEHAFLSDVRFDSFFFNGTWQKNVIASIHGSVLPATEIIVGGHFDSFAPSTSVAPGADDNATGAAAAIEMARVLVQAGYEPRMTFRFVGFAAEEVGLLGSYEYAIRARNAGEDIRAMLNYDMIGNRDTLQRDRDFHVDRYPGSEGFGELYAATAMLYTSAKPIQRDNPSASTDSWSFYQRGYPVVSCIEADFSPYYHTANDIPDHLDPPYIREIVKAGLAFVLTLDHMPPAVTGLRIRDAGNGSALFAQWDPLPMTDVTHFRIRAGRTSGSSERSMSTGDPYAYIADLTEGETWYVGVACVDLVGQEGMILELTGTPLLIPLPPADILPEHLGTGIRLAWSRNSEMDIDGYNIYRSDLPDTGFVLMTPELVQENTWTDTTSGPGSYAYYIVAVDTTGLVSDPSDTVIAGPVVGVSERTPGVPPVVTLHQNYPNPFNPTTLIPFDLEEESDVTLVVFDLLGREIARLLDRKMTGGRHDIVFDGSGLASGVYFYRLECRSHGPEHPDFVSGMRKLIRMN